MCVQRRGNAQPNRFGVMHQAPADDAVEEKRRGEEDYLQVLLREYPAIANRGA